MVASSTPSTETGCDAVKGHAFHQLLEQAAHEYDRVVEKCRAEIKECQEEILARTHEVEARRKENIRLSILLQDTIQRRDDSLLYASDRAERQRGDACKPCLEEQEFKDIPSTAWSSSRTGAAPELTSATPPLSSESENPTWDSMSASPTLDSMPNVPPGHALAKENGDKMVGVARIFWGDGDYMIMKCSIQAWRSFAQRMKTPSSFSLRPAFANTSLEEEEAFGATFIDNDVFCERSKIATTHVSDQIVVGNSACSRVLISPGSNTRISWDIAGTVFLAYDMIMIPLSAFGLERDGFTSVMEWCTLVFWTADMLMSCITGVVAKGTTVMEPRVILSTYLKSWFILDVVVVVPDWIFTIIAIVGSSSKGGATNSGRLLRVLRILRTVRLLRLAKLRRLLLILRDRIDSEATFIAINMVKNLMMLLMLNHFLASAWFACGTIGKDANSSNWIDTVPRLAGNVVYSYSTSLLWSICMFTIGSTNIQPQNVGESAFATLVLLCGLVVFTYFVSSMTAAIAQLKKMRGDRGKDLWMLRRFLRQHNVDQELTFRVLRYVDNAYAEWKNQNISVTKVEALGMLTDQLKREVQYEACYSRVSVHPLFNRIQSISKVSMFRLVGKALGHQTLARTDVLFSGGGLASFMYLVLSGELTYLKMIERDCESSTNVVVKDDWLTEPILWTTWSHLGLARATLPSDVVSIEYEGFAHVVCMDSSTLTFVSRYARVFIMHLNDLGRGLLSDFNPTTSELASEFAHSGSNPTSRPSSVPTSRAGLQKSRHAKEQTPKMNLTKGSAIAWPEKHSTVCIV